MPATVERLNYLITSHYQIVRHKDLAQSTTRVQTYLSQVLRLGYQDRFENFHRTEIPDQLTTPLNRIVALDAARISKWMKPQHRERIRPQFERCPAPFDNLVQTGYEKDRS